MTFDQYIEAYCLKEETEDCIDYVSLKSTASEPSNRCYNCQYFCQPIKSMDEDWKGNCWADYPPLLMIGIRELRRQTRNSFVFRMI